MSCEKLMNVSCWYSVGMLYEDAINLSKANNIVCYKPYGDVLLQRSLYKIVSVFKNAGRYLYIVNLLVKYSKGYI